MTTSAEQRAFFRAYPLPWGANTRLAQATGYANSTVSAWISGHAKMPREAFELALEILAESGQRIPVETANEVRASLLHSRKPTKTMPGPPTRPEPVIPSTFEELEHALRRAQLTDYQVLQLIRTMAS